MKKIEKIILLNKIEEAREGIKNGKGITNIKAKKKLKKWLK